MLGTFFTGPYHSGTTAMLASAEVPSYPAEPVNGLYVDTSGRAYSALCLYEPPC